MLCRATLNSYTAAVHIALECSGNIICIVGHRKDPVSTLGFELKAKAFKKLHRVTGRKSVERRIQKPAVTRDIRQKLLDIAVICHITATLARYAQLAAENFIRLKQDYIKTPLSCNGTAHHSRCAAAYHDHISSLPAHRHHVPAKFVQVSQRSARHFLYF